jgi:hypothetical protein
MDEIRPYSDVEISEIASGELLPTSRTLREKRLESENQKIYGHGPSKLLLDNSWVHKTVEELENLGRIDSEEHWTPNLEFKTELSAATTIKLMDAISDMLEHKRQDILKSPCFVEVTEGDNTACVKVHIIFDSFTGINHEKGE